MQVRAHTVADVRRLGGTGYVLRLDGPFEPAQGGQFCMLSTRRNWPVLLPRPFSYFDLVPGPGGFATFLGKAIGPGTCTLRDVAPGDEVIVTGPLGGSFPAVMPGAPEPLCIAGGVGLAPFLLWVKARQTAGAGPVTLLFGGATRDALVGHDGFPAGGTDLHLATDDGSVGFHGNVLELYVALVAEGRVESRAPVYCCGPDPMMHAVAAHCAKRGVSCHVSLETYMACGYGVCNGCTVRVRSQGRFAGRIYAKTCTMGPVFAAEELVW